MFELALIFSAALSRLIPHLPNFTAVSAVALYGAATLSDKKQAIWIPLAAMLVSDLVIEIFFRAGLSATQGIHLGMLYVYPAFMLVSAIGFWMRRNFSIAKLAAGTLAASVVFFAVTNFGVWLAWDFYPKSAEGLAACFIAAVPFFQNQVLGDLLFTGLLFGIDALIKSRSAKRESKSELIAR